jgi:hypothetical protein
MNGVFIGLDTPVAAEIRRGPDGLFVRLKTNLVDFETGETTPDPIDILYEELDDFIASLTKARRTIEAYMVLGDSVP